MSKQKEISVIVAAYNQEKYIGRCLRSLLNQNFPHCDYEILVVNDGSNDRTAYALELFSDSVDSLVQVITHTRNRGLPASLNSAINVSSSKYIVRVDADDFVNSNFLNLLHYYLETNPHRDAAACDYFLVDDNENVIERCNCLDQPIGCGILFLRSHLLDVGLYDEDFKYHEERELRVRFEKKYSISRLELPMYRYRRHGSNMTDNYVKMQYYETLLNQKHSSQNK